LVSLWDERKKLLESKSDSASIPFLVNAFSVRTAGSSEITQGPTRRRSRSKREKDKARQDTRDERKRLFSEAYHDNIHSLGEVDALTSSEALDVNRGDVLRDPKLRQPYAHPCLNRM
jgi:hypothetical protein